MGSEMCIRDSFIKSIDGPFTGESSRKIHEHLSSPATSIEAGHEESSNFLSSVDGVMNRAMDELDRLSASMAQKSEVRPLNVDSSGASAPASSTKSVSFAADRVGGSGVRTVLTETGSGGSLGFRTAPPAPPTRYDATRSRQNPQTAPNSKQPPETVSYTHLTLPTKRIV